MPQTQGALGHAERYDVVIHQRGGSRVYGYVDGVTAITWGRKLDDYSECTVEVAKIDASEECAGMLGSVHTWGHEVSIYRDGYFVWQGPLVTKTETSTGFTLEARDMLAWCDSRPVLNTYNWSLEPGETPNPDDPNYDPSAEVVIDAAHVIGKLLADAFGRGVLIEPRLDPGFMDYLKIPETVGQNASFQCMQAGEKNLGEALRSIVENGVDMFTIGRYICFYPTRYGFEYPPLRLTEYDFLDELEARENGLEAASQVVVIGQKPEREVSGGSQPASEQPKPIGTWPWMEAGSNQWRPVEPYDDFYGYLGYTQESDTATSLQRARQIAAQSYMYRYPAPVDVVVPDGARLSQDAPITVDELIPGYPVVLSLDTYRTDVQRRFVISECEFEVTVDESGMTEAIKVSLASHDVPPGTEEGP